MPKQKVVTNIQSFESDAQQIRLNIADSQAIIDISQKTKSLLPEILKSSQEDNAPMFFDINPLTGMIDEISIPFRKIVTSITEHTDSFLVECRFDPVDYILRKDIEDFDDTFKAISLSNSDTQKKTRVWIATKRGTKEIIGALVEPAANRDTYQVNYEYEDGDLDPVDLSAAEQALKFLRTLATPIENPLGGPSDPQLAGPSIPFQFVETGCTARAHEMCRRLKDAFDLHPIKIWIRSFETLYMQTNNHPECKVEWSFHVAPGLITKEGVRVLDPSMSRSLMTVPQFKAKLNRPTAKLYVTSPRVYQFYDTQTGFDGDPQYAETHAFIGGINRSLALLVEEDAAPPYEHCSIPN